MGAIQHIERDRIIQASITLFSEYGFHKITMDMLGNYLGCSKYVIYHYFSSKNSLIDAAARHVYGQLRIPKPSLQHIREQLKEKTPAQILRGYCYLNSVENANNRDLYRLLYKESVAFKRLAKISYYVWLNYYRALSAALDQLAELGAIPRQQGSTLAEMWTRVAFMYSLWQTFDPYCKEFTDVMEMLIGIAVNGVEMVEYNGVCKRWKYSPRPIPKSVEEEIIAASCELFSIHGYQNTTIRQIAAKLDIPLSKIYIYFETKQDLMNRILEYLRCRDIDYDVFQYYRRTRKIDDLISALSGSYILHDKYQVERYRIWVDMIYRDRACRYHILGRVVEKRIEIKNTIRELVAQRPITNGETYSLATIYLFNHASINIEDAMFYRDTSLTEKYRIDSAALQASVMLNGLKRREEAPALR